MPSYAATAHRPDPYRPLCSLDNGVCFRQSALVSDPILRLTYDRSADAVYISLQPADVLQPSVVRTESVGASINLDFDDSGRLVGVEVLSAKMLHPSLLAEADVAP